MTNNYTIILWMSGKMIKAIKSGERKMALESSAYHADVIIGLS